MLKALLLFISLIVCSVRSQSILLQFTSVQGSYVLNGTLEGVSPLQVASDEECATACVKFGDCVSFNYLDDPTQVNCELNQYKNTYSVIANGNWTYYLRNITRNDTPIKPQVQYSLQVPTSGVRFTDGILKTVFDNNLIFLSQFPLDDLLYFYQIRSGDSSPSGQCWGWDQNLKGSISGLFMMGAGNALRWTNNATLQAKLDALISGIAQYQDSDGFIMAYAKNETIVSENPNYVLSWVTHGLIDSYLQGNELALQLARDQISWYNYNPYIPEYLPPYDDAEYKPQCSLSGCGDHQGHGIYLEYQGMIHNTLMALSPLGVERDVELLTTLYQEDYWLTQLIERNLSGIWERMWFPHNYEITGIEAYLDLYVLTGNETYLNAVYGAWDMFYTHWIHVGGSIAINEVIMYPPGSYYLDGYDWGESENDFGDTRCGGPSVGDPHVHHAMEKVILDPNDASSGPHPTGENCGSVFWVKLNQRLHRLFPSNESYVTEIEREIYNVGVANQSPIGLGNRYFTVLHQTKAPPSNVGSCCEGQGTRFYGSFPEYVYSISETGVYVNLYASSVFNFVYQSVNVTLQMDTLFPYANNVTINITADKAVNFTLNVRVPSWAYKQVEFEFNGKQVLAGNPGSYVEIPTGGDTRGTLQFELPMQFRTHYYNGTGSPIPPYSRYAYEYGPILLAAMGPWNSQLGCIVISGVDPNTPASWLTEVSPLHFNVTGSDGYSMVPYFEIQKETFTVYPIIA